MPKRRSSKAQEPPPTLERAYFSQRLRRLREARGFATARAFAAEIGKSENAYRRYEAGEAEPDLQLIYRMLNVLAASPADLLGTYRVPAQLGAAVAPGPTSDRIAPAGLSEPDGSAYEPPSAIEQTLATDAAIWSLAERYVEVIAGEGRSAAENALAGFRAVCATFDAVKAAPRAELARIRGDLLAHGSDATATEVLLGDVARLELVLGGAE